MYTLKEMRRKEAAQDIDQFIKDTLVSKIRAYRIFFDVSQRELSRRSGVTQNIISRMENGIATPHLPTLMKLLNALDLDIEIKVTPREKDEVGILETLNQEKLKEMRQIAEELNTQDNKDSKDTRDNKDLKNQKKSLQKC